MLATYNITDWKTYLKCDRASNLMKQLANMNTSIHICENSPIQKKEEKKLFAQWSHLKLSLVFSKTSLPTRGGVGCVLGILKNTTKTNEKSVTLLLDQIYATVRCSTI